MAADRHPAMKRVAARRHRSSKTIVAKRFCTDLVLAHERPERPTVFMGIAGGQSDITLAARQCVRKIGAFKLRHHDRLQLLEAFWKLRYFLTADRGHAQVCRMGASLLAPLRRGANSPKKRHR